MLLPILLLVLLLLVALLLRLLRGELMQLLLPFELLQLVELQLGELVQLLQLLTPPRRRKAPFFIPAPKNPARSPSLGPTAPPGGGRARRPGALN